MLKEFYVYIACSRKDGALYIGVTSDLNRRMYEHRNKIFRGFTTKYNITHLVYYEIFESIRDAILREKQLKKWKRSWKIELIENINPQWKDLCEESLG